MPIGYAEIKRQGATVEILEEHAEVWIEVPESSLGRRDGNVRAAVSIGHMLEALRDAGYTITDPPDSPELPEVHPYAFWDAKKFNRPSDP